MAASAGCIDKTLMKQRPQQAGGMLLLLRKCGQNVQGGAAHAQSETVGGSRRLSLLQVTTER